MAFSVAILYVTSTVMIIIAGGIWLFRRNSGALALMGYALATAEWAFAIGRSIASPTHQFTLRSFYATRFGMVFIPVFFLVFAALFVKKGGWITPLRLLLLCVIPFITLIILWTPSLQNLYIRDVLFLRQGSYLSISWYRTGPWFYVQAAYSILLILFGIGILIWQAFHPSGRFRSQSVDLLLSTSPALFTLFGGAFHIVPDLERSILTPVMVAVTGLAFAWTYARHQILELTPIARWTQIEIMADGMLVMDKHKRITDLNPSMKKILENLDDRVVGRPAADIVPTLASLSETDWTSGHKSELTLKHGGALENYEMQLTVLKTRAGKLRGWLVTFHNVTQQKNILKKLEEMAVTDEMTKAINRNHFLNLLDGEIKRAVRYQYPLSFVIIDIDHFKLINDSFGHHIGDLALIEFSKTCRVNTRETDIFARLGGEEFGLLLPNTDLKRAFDTAERLRRSIEKLVIEADGNHVSMTISLGVSSLLGDDDQSGDLIKRADQALYAAKNAGRNKVMAQAKE